MNAVSDSVSQVKFAKHIGMSKAYVTQLKQAGRLVMERIGKRDVVLVAESLALIEETKDVNRKDVAKRHEENRAGEAEGKAEASKDVLSANASQAVSKAVTEEYKAKSAKLAYEREIGLVVDADEVKKAGASIGIAVRSALENLPDQLAPELAPMDDPARIHAVLVEGLEQVLNDLALQLHKMSEAK